MPFAAVATSLHNGAEIWLRRARRSTPCGLDRDARIIRPGAFRRNGAGGRRTRQSGARVAGARDGRRHCDCGRSRLGHPGSSPAPELRPQSPAGAVDDWIRKLQDKLGLRYPSASPDESDDAVAARGVGLQHQHHASADCAAAWPASRPTWSWPRAWPTFVCSTFTGPRKRSRKVAARWSAVAHILAELNHAEVTVNPIVTS